MSKDAAVQRLKEILRQDREAAKAMGERPQAKAS